MKDIKKRHVIIDLKLFNRITVSDNYPLPLQQKIINAIRGKKYLTIINITNFFFQLIIHPDYKDRFTFINQRGMKRSNVYLIGYMNFLPYTQCFIDRTLEKHRSYYRIFIDNIIIFSYFYKDHY